MYINVAVLFIDPKINILEHVCCYIFKYYKITSIDKTINNFANCECCHVIVSKQGKI